MQYYKNKVNSINADDVYNITFIDDSNYNITFYYL